MIKQFAIATTCVAALCSPARAQFTATPQTYSPSELGVTASALSGTALGTALDNFDARVPAMAHPRLFKGQADYAGIVAATKAERSTSITALTGYLKRNPVANTSAALRANINAADSAVRMSTWWQQTRILEGMAEAAVAWYITRDPWFLNEMRARMTLFTPAVLARKCSGDVAETRDYVWFYGLAYDFAYAGMSASDRQAVKNILLSCGNAGLLKVADTVRLYSENGIAFNALGKFVGALLIVRGDMPEMNSWLRNALPTYVAGVSPWGGDDGGFANGSTYAEWDAGESLIMWDLVERVLGVPFYRKPWLTEFARFIAYALPPGTPAGVFGDGAEVNRKEDWARFGKAIMNRSDTTLSRWYSKQQSGEDYARLHILLSPRESTASAVLPATQPSGAYFPVIGWSIMHSALTDRLRTSVFFKSSPFGSVNHSHADQNSFVLYAKGTVLAMDSGVYDYYNSPHWRSYYKQTRAHNAITVDGGQGQGLGPTGLGERAAAGRLTRFEQTPAYDISSGDASAAYSGLLSKAKRTVIFIRPSTLVTVDQLASTVARRYEYNLHTPVPLSGTAAAFRAANAPAELCGAVASPDALAISSSQGYYPAPTTPAGPHYWNKFSFSNPRTSGLIVSVLRTDCLSAKPDIVFGSSGATITAGGRVITVSDLDVTVQ
ncbi:heparinase II/III domain-containing protein [Massilia sp. TSP1-1-2]|uniref:heparinase II/III domain-containing protein n=1 Tax=Massilia sp. TSP1-1-2 TaxID=2804649 RepID=UPI003CF5B860